MIYTITLNPALDCSLYTDRFVINETNHYQRATTTIGGKGINVALVLNRLGNQVTAIGLFGSDNLKIFTQKFQQEHLKYHLIEYPGATRINYKIKNLKAKEETELNGEGFPISKELIKQLFNYLETHLKPNDLVIVGGSIPTGLKADTYRHLGHLVQEKGAIFFLDSTKEWLSEGLKAKPYLIKPNLAELKETFGLTTKGTELDEMISVIRHAANRGAQNILLSMGGAGSYFFASDGSILKVGIATGKLVNSVGAGDSMLAGFVHGLKNHLSIEDTLKYAAAAGGATAFSEELGSKALINHYQPKINVEILKGKRWK